MLEAGQLGAQILLNRCRRGERCTTLHLVLDGLARGVQNLVSRRRQVVTLGVAHHQRGIERGKGQLRHDRAPVVADGRQDASAHSARRP